MTEEHANKIYDILVTHGGALNYMRDGFVYNHTELDCKEWRFGGKLGFGGKYRSRYNTVDCYSEHETPEMLELINLINTKLREIA